ncbi:hypothetical protein [Marinicauda pacifica]|uniref:hypothetical protein n=1 Tax=Marinicauda pacifica TaxID=1133559 RepID=UPI0035C7CCAF
MDRTRFDRLVSAYGAAPSRWPAADREAALAFLRDHADDALHAQLEEAARLDRLLESARDLTGVPGNLEARLLASGPGARSRPDMATPRWASMAAAVALIGGLGLGWSFGETGQPDRDDMAIYIAAFDSLQAENSAWVEEE